MYAIHSYFHYLIDRFLFPFVWILKGKGKENKAINKNVFICTLWMLQVVDYYYTWMKLK